MDDALASLENGAANQNCGRRERPGRRIAAAVRVSGAI